MRSGTSRGSSSGDYDASSPPEGGSVKSGALRSQVCLCIHTQKSMCIWGAAITQQKYHIIIRFLLVNDTLKMRELKSLGPDFEC